MKPDGATRGGGGGGRRGRGIAAAALGLLLAIAGAACSLTNVKHDACTNDDQCAGLFGSGSKCAEGYCTDPATAGCQKTGADGRACFSCTPKTTQDFEAACTTAQCSPFDDSKRLTKLTADGGLPPLP